MTLYLFNHVRYRGNDKSVPILKQGEMKWICNDARQCH